MKVQRAYVITQGLFDATAHVASRSVLICSALEEAVKDPTRLLTALKQRIESRKPPSGMKRIGLSIEPSLIESTNALANDLGLPVEHVMRLAIEAYLSKRTE